jgi:ABC-type transport system involved in cytochrome bd biosynthesis fused ATPase/permease subunit
MHLNCPDEVARYVGATLREILADPLVEAELKERPIRVRLGLVDPDCVLYVDSARHDVRLGSDSDITDAVIAMAGDTALACLLGLIDIDAAIESGSVITAGEARRLLELLSARTTVADRCADVLRREGRSDLLELAG